jgi:uncharacterized membrane protein
MRKNKLFWFFILGVIPYLLGRIINFYYGFIPFPEDKLIYLLLNNLVIFYLGVLPVIFILGIISRIEEHYK